MRLNNLIHLSSRSSRTAINITDRPVNNPNPGIPSLSSLDDPLVSSTISVDSATTPSPSASPLDTVATLVAESSAAFIAVGLIVDFPELRSMSLFLLC